MKISRFARSVLAASAMLSAASLGTAAIAQAINPGMQVVDPSGNAVGTVTAVKGDLLMVKTDRHEVQLPATSFTPSEGKLLFGMTRDQLNAETDKALAQAAAAIVVGAEVRGTGGEVAGSIDAIEGDIVTLKLVTGELVRLPRTALAGSAAGVVLGVTAEELKAMAEQAAAAQ